jgi:hypothetical protein
MSRYLKGIHLSFLTVLSLRFNSGVTFDPLFCIINNNYQNEK